MVPAPSVDKTVFSLPDCPRSFLRHPLAIFVQGCFWVLFCSISLCAHRFKNTLLTRLT